MLYLKEFRDGRGEMYLYFPGVNRRTPYKRSGLFVLMDDVNSAHVEQVMAELDLETLCRDEEIVLAFPVPGEGGWQGEACEDFALFYDGITKADDEPLTTNAIGIPTLEAMTSTWHPMNDVRYVIGLGSGADFALRLCAEKPEWFAGVWTVGGCLPEATVPAAPMPAWLSGADSATAQAFCRANEVDTAEGNVHLCKRNPVQRVILEDLPAEADSVRQVWHRLFRTSRRVNTCVHGDLTNRLEDARKLFECYVEDDRLDGRNHTWFVSVPASLKEGEKVPLVVFFHGGSDNPAEAAEMCRLHELGEEEGFITVYPWGSNRCSWNSSMEPDLEDDVAYSAALIRYMLRHYPVDAQRVYLSGFSNGAGPAMSVAMCPPELVAALFPIDATWPGIRGKYMELEWQDVIPFRLGMERKAEMDYRIPVWYTYGSREPSYPVRRDSTQQHQYDYWKMYNHVPIRPTPARDEDGDPCGVAGDIQETLRPSTTYPDHWYEVNRFLDDRGENLYNYVVMHDKGHEVAEQDARLGWQYVRKYRRLPDGTLLCSKE